MNNEDIKINSVECDKGLNYFIKGSSSDGEGVFELKFKVRPPKVMDLQIHMGNNGLWTDKKHWKGKTQIVYKSYEFIAKKVHNNHMLRKEAPYILDI